MTLYEKVGKRYKPVREEREWDSWPAGFHLVYSNPEGGRSTRFNIAPDRIGLEAAAREKEEAIRKVIADALAMRPSTRPVTPAQAEAWENFQNAMGKDRYIVEYESVNGIIDGIIEVLLR